MSVETVDKGLNRGFVQVTKVGCALARLLTEHERLWVDQAKRVNDDFALDGLDGIDDNSDGTRVQLLETLLGVDVNRREPAAEPGVRMVPSNDGFGSVVIVSA